MAAVFTSLLPVFLMILTGAALRRLLLPSQDQWSGVENLVYYVLFPALLIDTLARAALGSVPAGRTALTLATAVILMSLLCLGLRRAVAVLRLDGPAFTSLFQGATRWQTFVALAVADNLFAEQGVALAAVAMAAMIPLLNVLSVWILARYASPVPPAWRTVGATMARNPLIWACALGALLNVISLVAPTLSKSAFAGFLFTLLGWLGGAALPVGLLVVGSGLSAHGLLRPRRVAFMATGLKLVVMPALAVMLGLAFGLRDAGLAVVACCAAVPSASNAYVLARQMGGDAPLMADILTLQTIVAIATMPAAIAIARALG